MGLPVFAGGGGAAYLTTSPTAGLSVGHAARHRAGGCAVRRGWDTTVARTLGALLAGTGVIFTVGVTWLGYQIGQEAAIASGLRPFLGSEAPKIAMVALRPPCRPTRHRAHQAITSEPHHRLCTAHRATDAVPGCPCATPEDSARPFGALRQPAWHHTGVGSAPLVARRP